VENLPGSERRTRKFEDILSHFPVTVTGRSKALLSSTAQTWDRGFESHSRHGSVRCSVFVLSNAGEGTRWGHLSPKDSYQMSTIKILNTANGKFWTSLVCSVTQKEDCHLVHVTRS
jgi:hypothetical protein